MADNDVVAERKKQKAQKARERYANMPLEKRLELNAKRRDDYHRKKLERQTKETVDAPSNKNIQGPVLGEINLNTLDTFLL